MGKEGWCYKTLENSPEEKRDPVSVRAGCHGCWAHLWGDLVPGGCPPTAQRRVLSSSVFRLRPLRIHALPPPSRSPTPCCEKCRFPPQNRFPGDRAVFAPAPRQKRNLIPVLDAPLGFLRAISGSRLLPFQRFHHLSPSFFRSFPPSLPPSVFPTAPPPRHGSQRRIIAIA